MTSPVVKIKHMYSWLMGRLFVESDSKMGRKGVKVNLLKNLWHHRLIFLSVLTW